MKSGNWIAADKNLVYYMPRGRAYSIVEAYMSHAIDIDNGRQGSISGYSKLWGWSRNKVRKFLQDLEKQKGQKKDRQGTGKGQALSLKTNNLGDAKDTRGTGKGQKKDTTIEPKPKPNKIPIVEIEKIVANMNKILGTSYLPSTASIQRVIMARLKEGFVVADFEKVVRIKFAEWEGDRRMVKFLRPLTLFSGKFQDYLQQKEVKPKPPGVQI
jgi:uncharacterized phage protein (TIGR02220 family)